MKGIADKTNLALIGAGTELKEGVGVTGDATSTVTFFEPGGGAFRFDDVVVGVVLCHQPKHSVRLGDAKFRDLPLIPGSGWIFPAGLDGECHWHEDQKVLNLAINKNSITKLGINPGNIPLLAGTIDPLIAQLAVHLHVTPQATRLYHDSLTLALIAQLGQLALPSGPAPSALDPRLTRAIDYIEAHLEEDLSLEALAGIAALSPFHFSRSFKAATGVPPHKYLMLRRVERAKVFLATTKLPVAEIAFRVGYQDVSRFTSVFRRETGVTPGAFRKDRI
jgi:AraC family transcriptional regulator